MQSSVTIYAIVDELNPKIPKYIGKTTRTLDWRLKQHKANMSRRVGKWMSEIQSEGRKAIIYSLEICKDRASAKERETHWIRFFRPLGSLLNFSDGDGGLGTKIVRSLKNIQITIPKLKEANERRKVRVICRETGEEFESIRAAARGLGYSQGGFRDSIKMGWKVRGRLWQKLVKD